MKYVPIPIAMLEVGKPLPVDVVSNVGQLLLRKGQPIVSEQHRAKLHGFHASTSVSDGLAWQRAYERLVHELLRSGMDVREIAKAPMPTEIREVDYVVGKQLHGGWLDLQEVLRGILYQGGLAMNPMQRLADIQAKAQTLVKADADDSLFCLFQALTDDALGYCATHALLCAVMCELTAPKVGLDVHQRQSLLASALTMNIGMARDQDSMTRQGTHLTDWQRQLIEQHPALGADILTGFGVDDEDQLDIVRWHGAPDAPEALPRNQASRRLLALADTFVARTAARKTRTSQSAVKAVKTMILNAQGDALGVGSAMAQAVGFYPPGTYVLLVNGETAVSVKRGQRANMPWVISIADKDGMPTVKYQCKDTSDPALAIASPVNFEAIKVTVNMERVRRARERIPAKV
jgi:HD-GYP domain-containing protein (c-di-GMP phosphodiesterase class II)